MFEFGGREIVGCKYFELYHDNKNDYDVMYLECLVESEENPEIHERIVLRIPEFESDDEYLEDVTKRVEYGTLKEHFKSSFAAQIPNYKYESLRDEFLDKSNTIYDETILYTGVDEDLQLDALGF